MQNKGAIRVIAIIFALIFLYQLSFTLVTKRVEKKAEKYAEAEATKLSNGDESQINLLKDQKETYYLDSVSNVNVYNLGFKKYTYRDAKEREINLGLDLKGGMNVTLEVSVKDIVKALSGDSQDPVFLQAMEEATRKQEESKGDFVTLFGEAFEKADPNASLASIFLYEFKDKGIDINSSNSDVLKVLKEESDAAIDRSYQILGTRIDRFGVAQPNIQKMENSGRILVELPGIKDPERVRKLLQGTAQLEFWETYNFSEVQQYFAEADAKLAEVRNAKEGVDTPEVTEAPADSTATVAEEGTEVAETVEPADSTANGDLLNELTENKTEEEQVVEDQTAEEIAKNHPLLAKLQMFNSNSARVGIAMVKDTAAINQMLAEARAMNIFPRQLKLAWTKDAQTYNGENGEGGAFLDLVALKMSRDNKCALGGEVITDARQDYGQNNQVEVTIQMNQEGAKTWKRLTSENIGKQIAIVLDDLVYSYPVVNGEIPNGRSSISGGGMTIEEAQDLANILKAGKLPAPARILEEQVVGPSLGKEAVQKGMWSMVFAFILVLVYMVFFYKKAGLVADIALLVNVFFLFGVLACLGSVLTLPGIAGIVLTLGMAVDSNVIIFERIKEEIKAGKGIKLAIADGYKNAYSAIIDGQVTTLLTGIILYIFGSGPVQGFATTLIIGIITSVLTSIFITRLIFDDRIAHNKTVSLSNKFSRNFLKNTKIDFLGARKYSYMISGALILLSLCSIFFKGFSYGVDFTGGRTYVVRFDQAVTAEDVRAAVEKTFQLAAEQQNIDQYSVEVKQFGGDSQMKITTQYKNNDENTAVDSEIESLLYDALKGFYAEETSLENFTSTLENPNGIISSDKVGPTIARDIQRSAIISVLLALLVIFGYIALRFRGWTWGLGGVVSLAHTAIIVIGFFSLFNGILPFNLDVDQTFIAAILTIIGYAINDNVVIFDRIREQRNLHPNDEFKKTVNTALNATLTRTVNTSVSTLLPMLAIAFFGGESIRGLSVALCLGILIGTYASIMIGTPVMYDATLKAAEKQAKKK